MDCLYSRIDVVELRFSSDRLVAQLVARLRRTLQPVCETDELSAREIKAQGAQLLCDPAVGARCRSLALEWPYLPSQLAKQVTEPLEVLLGGREPPICTLAPAPVLQHSGGLFNHRPALLGTGVQNLVELALSDDDVLGSAHPRVTEQLLYVEQPAGLAVDGVLAVAGPKQRARDGDLGESARKAAGSVVDGERHLGTSESRSVGRAGEDDVFHLRASKRPRALGAEHPRDGVHDVGLSAPVGPYHHRHARLEVQGHWGLRRT